MALLLSLLMLVTAVPLAVIPASATVTTANVDFYSTVTQSSGNRSGDNYVQVTSDGAAGNTTLGVLRFNISSWPETVVSATLNLNCSHAPSVNNSAVTEIYSATDHLNMPTGSPSATGIFGDCFDSAYGANNANHLVKTKAYFGLGEPIASKLNKDLPDAVNDGNKQYGNWEVDVTDALNAAKAAGQSVLQLIITHPTSYDTTGNIWSDVNIRPNNTTLVYDDGIIPSAAEVQSVNANSLNGITDKSFSTAVTTIHGNFANDSTYTSAANYAEIYKNVLYSSPSPVSVSGSDVDYQVLLNAQCYWNNYYARWYHATTVLMYEGEKNVDNMPSTGVMMFYASSKNAGNGDGHTHLMSSYMTDGNGLELVGNWRGRDAGRSGSGTGPVKTDMQNTWCSKKTGTVSKTRQANWSSYGSAGTDYFDNTGNENTFANIMRFTGSMSNTEFSRTITPKFGFTAKTHNQTNNTSDINDGKSTGEKIGTSNRSIYVINYLPLKNALVSAQGYYNQVNSNPAKYDTEWVANFKTVANQLIAAKPNNFINSTSSNVSGYASAASAAVTAFNNLGSPKLAQYAVKFKDYQDNVTKIAMFNYGTNQSMASIAPANNIVSINDNEHNVYTWDQVIPSSTLVNDNIEYQERYSTTNLHTFTTTDLGDGTHKKVCSVCGFEKVEEHTTSVTSKNADGHTIACSTCTFTSTVPHTYSAAEKIHDQDCVYGETWQQTCTYAGCDYVNEYVTPGKEVDTVNGHNFTWNNIAVGQPGSNLIPSGLNEETNKYQHRIVCQNGCGEAEYIDCTPVKGLDADGNVACVCSVCGQVVECDWYQSAPAIAATCQSNGYTATQTCHICGATKGHKMVENTKLNHDYSSDEVVPVAGQKNKHARKCVNGCGLADPRATYWVDCTFGEYEETKAPGCATAGEEKATCVCGNEDVREIPATEEHDKIYTATTNGQHVITCANCSYREVVNCTFEVTSHTDATCYAEGSISYKCEFCENTDSETIEKKAHTFDYDEKPAVVDGNHHAWTCTVCAAANVENPGKDVRVCSGGTASCTEASTCETCGQQLDKALGHDMTKTEFKAPTCEDDGTNAYYTCERCGKVFKDENGTAETSVASEVIATAGHNYTGTVANAGNGEHYYACANNCGTYGVGKNKNETESCVGGTATCVAKKVCTVCNTAYGDVDLNNHVGETEVRDAKTANCHEKGYTGDTYCLSCNTKIDDGEEIGIDASNHDGETEVRDAKTANCHEKGYTGDTYCLGCNTKIDDGEEIGIDATNHDGETEVRDAKTANCHEKGYTGDTYCLGCNTKIDDGEEIGIDATNHDGETEVRDTKTANCHEKGYTGDTYCLGCNTKIDDGEEIAINAENHVGATEVRDVVVANCHTEGYTGDTYCLGCNNKIADGSNTGVDLTKHDGATEVRNAVEANCHTEGYTGDTYCLGCNNKIADGSSTGVDLTKHDGATEVRGEIKANCHAGGYTGDTYCLGCNTKIGTGSATAVDSANHDGKTERRNVVVANCHTEGYTGDTYCLGCGNKIADGENTGVDLKNHDGETELRGVVTANCHTKGYTGDTYCLGCETIKVKGKTTVADLTNHDGETEVRGAEDATCESAGYTGDTWCLGCATMISKGKAIAALGHDYDENDKSNLTRPVYDEETGTWSQAYYTVTCGHDETHTTKVNVARATYTEYETVKAEVEALRDTEGLTEVGLVKIETALTDNSVENDLVADEQNIIDTATENLRKVKAEILANKNGEYIEVDTAPDFTKIDNAIEAYNEFTKNYPNELTTAEKRRVFVIVSDVNSIRANEEATMEEYQQKLDDYADEIMKLLSKHGVCPEGGTHQWSGEDEYKIIKLPTETETGIKAHYCIKCGEFQEPFENIPSLSHTHKGEWKVLKQPGCETTGLREMQCTDCGQNITEVIPAYGHDWGEAVVVTEANCVQKGLKRVTCERCKQFIDEVIPMKQDTHRMIIIASVAPTCDEDGLTEGRRCADCGKWKEPQEVIPKLGHVDKDGDGQCDICKVDYVVSVDDCSCICHKTSGLMKFLYKLIKPIWRLFKISQYCDCHQVDHWAK
ncbi:MAG: hypothetical protein NC185_01620 [Ruminococcus sp.]|nr:hypothetical protein [Ruminococcus sp.]